MTHLQAPWTAEQVAHLNAYQQSGRMHPFTCGRRDQHPSDPGVLVATEQGWHCPADDCDYAQTWALPFMAAPLPDDPAQELLARMRAERQAGRDAVAAVDELRAVFKRWFLDAHAGVDPYKMLLSIGADLQRVLAIADGKGGEAS